MIFFDAFQNTMNAMPETILSPILNLLSKAHDVKLVIDGVFVQLTIGPQSRSAPIAEVDRPEPQIFRRENGGWRIQFNGHSLTRKGLERFAYVHQLLRQPHVFIPAETLWIQTTGENVEAKSEKEFANEGYAELGLHVQSSQSESVVSEETRANLLSSLEDLEEDLAQLQEDGEEALVIEKEQEIKKVREYLRKASFQGRIKQFAAPSEKARKRISVAISRAIGDLEKEHPALARHLDNSIRTGKQCTYAPETAVHWIL